MKYTNSSYLSDKLKNYYIKINYTYRLQKGVSVGLGHNQSMAIKNAIKPTKFKWRVHSMQIYISLEGFFSSKKTIRISSKK